MGFLCRGLDWISESSYLYLALTLYDLLVWCRLECDFAFGEWCFFPPGRTLLFFGRGTGHEPPDKRNEITRPLGKGWWNCPNEWESIHATEMVDTWVLLCMPRRPCKIHHQSRFAFPFPLKNSDFPLLFWFSARDYYSLRVTWRDLSPTCFTQESPLLTSWVQSLFRATFMHFILALHLFVMISTQKIQKDPKPQLQKLHYLMDVNI